MFKRENRLLTGTKFNNANFFSTPRFILKVKTNGLNLNRFGIVVSKKNDKRAVVRNKIKRIFRTALFELSEKMITGHDILFIVKSGVLSKAKEENYTFIKNSLEKAGLLK